MAGIQDYIGYLYNANIDTLILYIIKGLRPLPPTPGRE